MAARDPSRSVDLGNESGYRSPYDGTTPQDRELDRREAEAAAAAKNSPPPAPRLGPPLPIVFGTARVTGRVIDGGAQYYPGTWDGPTDETRPTVATWAFLALCEAPISAVTAVWLDGTKILPENFDLLVADNVTVNGDTKQGAYDFVLTDAPTQWARWADAVGGVGSEEHAYAGTAQFRAAWLGCPDGVIPKLEFEVKWNGTVDGNGDANPADVIVALVESPTFGLGLPSGTVDVAAYRAHCTTKGYGVSRAITERMSVDALIDELLEATSATALWTGGKLKIIPLNDAAGSGVLIDDDEIILEEGEDPVTVEIVPDEETFNQIPVVGKDRAADYRETVYQYQDDADISVRGPVPSPRVVNGWISRAEHAHRISSVLVRRSLRVRNRYRFKVGPRHAKMEAGDKFGLTHSRLGLVNEPAMILSIRDLPDGNREIVAPEYPAGVTSVDLTTQPHDGLTGPPRSYPLSDAQAAQDGVTAVTTLVNTKTTTYQQSAAPAGPNTVGDLWFDSDDGNKPYRWDGAAWVSAQDGSIALVGGGSTTYVQATAPTGDLIAGDLWFESDAGNKLYRWNGSSWVVVQDAGAAAGATANKTYIQTTQPTGGTYVAGDLWFDSDDGNRPYRWSGSAWAQIQSGVRTYYQTTEPVGGAYLVGDLWYDTDDNNAPHRWSGSAWVDVRDGTIATAQSDATSALTLAGTKTRVFYKTSAPTNADAAPSTVKLGDIWFNTSSFTASDVTAGYCATADIGKSKYWAYTCTAEGSTPTWSRADDTSLVVAAKIAAGAVTADKVTANDAFFDAVATGRLKTSNYAEDGSGNPTAGAKLDHQGTALKVAPGNFQLGKKVLSRFGMCQMYGFASKNSGSSTWSVTCVTDPLAWSYSLQGAAGSKVLRVSWSTEQIASPAAFVQFFRDGTLSALVAASDPSSYVDFAIYSNGSFVSADSSALDCGFYISVFGVVV